MTTNNQQNIQEVVDPHTLAFTTAMTLGGANLAIILGKIIKSAVSDTFQKAIRDRDIGEAATKEKTKEAVIQRIANDIVTFLKNYSKTQKIVSTGSHNFKNDAAELIKTEVDSALSKFNFTPVDKIKIKYLVFKNLTV